MKIKLKEKNVKITRAEEIAEIFYSILKAEDKEDRMKEHLWCVYLNARNVIIKIELVSLGTLNASIVHPREVFSPAITSKSASLIMGHNHPSNDTAPSSDDIEITKRIKEAGRLLGIELLDHIIIGSNKHFSNRGGYTSLKEKMLF
jgi:DNA repair protein RadC